MKRSDTLRVLSTRLFDMAAGVLLAGICLFSTGLMTASAGAGQRDAIRVVRVNDGDTITVLDGGRHKKVRMIGVDAPELGQRPWGDRAMAYLAQLMARSSWQVVLEYDIDRVDKHGRALAYVRTADGRLANEEMLRSGNAVLFTFPPNVRHVDRLRAAQQQARQRRIGIWERGGLGERPSEWRRVHPRR